MTLRNNDLTQLLLRVACGGLLLFHGFHKVVVEIDHVKDLVVAAGLPSFLAYGNLLGEFVAPIFLIIGYKARLAALVIVINMLATIFIAHRDIMFVRNSFGAWMIETNVLYMMTALAIVFAGSGKYSLSNGRGRWD